MIGHPKVKHIIIRNRLISLRGIAVVFSMYRKHSPKVWTSSALKVVRVADTPVTLLSPS